MFLHEVFKTKLPKWLKPQPVIIIVDEVERMLYGYRADFLVAFRDLMRQVRDGDMLRLIFVVNSKKAVKALELMDETYPVEIVHVPKVCRESVVKNYGKKLAEIFDECSGSIDIAMDYEMDIKYSTNLYAKEYTERLERIYAENCCLVKEITPDEYNLAVKKRQAR